MLLLCLAGRTEQRVAFADGRVAPCVPAAGGGKLQVEIPGVLELLLGPHALLVLAVAVLGIPPPHVRLEERLHELRFEVLRLWWCHT
eukprot:697296-Pyramimonas_sp.AAC.2